MDVIGWLVVYTTDDGLKVYTSKDTAWEDLPGDGLLDGVLFKDARASDGERYRESIGGPDYYFIAPHQTGGLIYGRNNDPPDVNLRRYPGLKRGSIKRGKWTTNAEMAEAARIVSEATWP